MTLTNAADTGTATTTCNTITHADTTSRTLTAIYTTTAACTFSITTTTAAAWYSVFQLLAGVRVMLVAN